MKYIPLFLLAVFALSMSGCQSGKPSNLFHYAHFSHTRIRDEVKQKIDPRVAQIDFRKFDLLMLGGDLCENTSKDFETLEYLDNILDLSSPDVLWAVGNHDNTNLEYVERITKKPTSYAYYKNGITFLVLNLHWGRKDWKINVNEAQQELIRNVADTISESTHLIVMTHKLVWILWHPEMKEHVGKNGPFSWDCNYGISRNNWNEKVLPHLQRTQRKGIQVICLAGDIGNRTKSFEEFTSDGIVYLASGINPVDHDVQFLLFKHEPPELNWEFVNLEKYLAAGQKWEVTRKIVIEP